MNNTIEQKTSYIKPQMTVLEFKQEAPLLDGSCIIDCNSCNDDDIEAVLED
ncbi:MULTISPECIES: hypothetical protein [unclassified Fibrobacter]|uniref:hypothetical protein n=1 Tax=unclassified Fibrobacter TaxID=2634177 RepID=UPI0009142299|nr:MULTISPECIES: hypothetical protein [unclassified Fibrobacter]SHK68968.1 hypothetical protein SAMN05720759_105142 [Fibrobacter sp. UWB12]SIO03587.1 hypothetical protein SAMN05720758_1115 [Fibrobacter sp. UWB11]